MKLKLLATTAAIAGMLVAASPAHAGGWNNGGYNGGNGNGNGGPDVDPDANLDDVFWSWDKSINETVDINVNISSDLLPEGHVEIDKTQIFNGDVRSEVIFMGDYAVDPDLGGDAGPDVDPDDNGNNGYGKKRWKFGYNGGNGNGNGTDPDVDPDLEPGIEPTLDALTDLGLLVGDSTAIANYQSIQTETATFLRDEQIHNSLNSEDGYGVHATALAGDMDDPVEAAVDLTATAISNYLSVEGSPQGLDDNVLIASISQESDANVFASATTVQDLSNFGGLGGYTGVDADMPGLVGRLSATAIGNYASFSFGPSVDLLGE